MSKNTSDRRIYRTRSALQQALFSLLYEQRYEEIDVQDICNAANVGRSTFYSHYASKDELKKSGIENLRTALLNRLNATSTRRVPAFRLWSRSIRARAPTLAALQGASRRSRRPYSHSEAFGNYSQN